MVDMISTLGSDSNVVTLTAVSEMAAAQSRLWSKPITSEEPGVTMIRPSTGLYTAWRDGSGEVTLFSKPHGRFDTQLANQQKKKGSTSCINDMLEMSRFCMQMSMNGMMKEDMEPNLHRPQALQIAP